MRLPPWRCLAGVLALGALLVGAAGGGIVLAARPNLPVEAEQRFASQTLPQVADGENAFGDYLAAGRSFRLAGVNRAVWLRRAQRPRLEAEVEQVLAANDQAMRLLRSGHGRPRYLSVATEVARPASSRDYRMLGDLGRLSFVRCRVALRAGDHATAFQAMGDALMLGRRMMYAPGEPMMSRLQGVRIAESVNLLLQFEPRTFERAPLPALEALLARLNALDALERPVVEALLTEKHLHLTAFQSGYPRAHLPAAPLLAKSASPTSLEALAPLLAEARQHSRHAAWFLEHHFRTALIYDRQALALSRRDLPGFLAEVRRYEQPAWLADVSSSLYPSEFSLAWRARMVARVPLRLMLAEARFEAMRVAAARAIARRNGRPASGWAGLVPGLLPLAPSDPFLGAALEWRGDHLVSVGWDGRPQAGPTIDMRHPQTLATWDLAGDIRLL